MLARYPSRDSDVDEMFESGCIKSRGDKVVSSWLVSHITRTHSAMKRADPYYFRGVIGPEGEGGGNGLREGSMEAHRALVDAHLFNRTV